ncbi:hypothetical protein GGX14DRAFT_459015 [Mycena pura]|uniref:Uncharacterized protein n=1 Tax=Mycena pura TaxID=153505 RepID=A0AAD6VEL3_9AGAR|nr:hypothetical protein GGX14DRAFT_459015 [Mycena pura]
MSLQGDLCANCAGVLGARVSANAGFCTSCVLPSNPTALASRYAPTSQDPVGLLFPEPNTAAQRMQSAIASVGVNREFRVRAYVPYSAAKTKPTYDASQSVHDLDASKQRKKARWPPLGRPAQAHATSFTTVQARPPLAQAHATSSTTVRPLQGNPYMHLLQHPPHPRHDAYTAHAPLLPPVSPPKHVIVPSASGLDPDQAPPVAYATLALLLADLNRLLCTPHEHYPFHFMGTCAVVSDPAVGHAARVMRVAWEIIQRTVLSFNVHRLTVATAPHVAVVTTKSSALWMGADKQAIESTPCRLCQHLLVLHVTSDDSRAPIEGQRMTVGLKHFPT